MMPILNNKKHITKYLQLRKVFGKGQYEIKGRPKKIRKGIIQDNYLVCLEKPFIQDLFFRFYPNKGPKPWDFVNTGNWKAAKEVLLCGLMKQANVVPVPEVYWYDPRKDFFDKAFIILEYIHGHSYDETLAQTPERKHEIIQGIAKNQARINSIEFCGFGLLPTYEYQFNELSYFDFEWGVVKKSLDILKQSVLRSQEYSTIFEAISKYEPALNAIKTFQLLHGDWHGDNILMREDRVVGIVDWELSMSRCYLYELAQALMKFKVPTQIMDEEDFFITYFTEYRKNASVKYFDELYPLFKALYLFNISSIRLIQKRISKERLLKCLTLAKKSLYDKTIP